MMGSSLVLQVPMFTRCTSVGSSPRIPSTFSRTSARIMSVLAPQSTLMPTNAPSSPDREDIRCTFGSVLSASSTGLAIDSNTCPGVEFG
jgi:hypothetical protein